MRIRKWQAMPYSMINSQECGSCFGSKCDFDRFNILFYWQLTKIVLRQQQDKENNAQLLS